MVSISSPTSVSERDRNDAIKTSMMSIRGDGASSGSSFEVTSVETSNSGESLNSATETHPELSATESSPEPEVNRMKTDDTLRIDRLIVRKTYFQFSRLLSVAKGFLSLMLKDAS